MNAIAERLEHFKSCAVCGKSWRDLREFLLDEQLRVEGYQACFIKPSAGLVMVTHCAESCGTTLAISAESLKELYDGPEHLERLTGTIPCHGYCLRQHLLEECDVHCDMAWVRTALQWLRRKDLPPHMKE